MDFINDDTTTVRKEKSLLMMDERTPIESVYIDVWGDDDIRHEAAAEVKYDARVVNAMDPRLGATEMHPCRTCYLEFPRCPGHWGYIDLGDYYVRSSYVQKQWIQMIISVVCIHCHRPYADFHTVLGGSVEGGRLGAAHEYMKKLKDPKCAVCENMAFRVVETDTRNPELNRFSELTLGVPKKDLTMSVPISVIRDFLLGLSTDTLRTIGVESIALEDFFFNTLPVMPNNVRPPKNFEGQERSHQFTMLYERIAKTVSEMKSIALGSSYKTYYDEERRLYFRKIYVKTLADLRRDDYVITAEELELVDSQYPGIIDRYETVKTRLREAAGSQRDFTAWQVKRRVVNLHIREFDNAYGKQTFLMKTPLAGERFTPILVKSEGVNTDMNTLIKSKHGLVREKIMGKRVNFCARTVASPAPFRGRSDEVWLPEKFRNTLLMTEEVNEELRPTLRRMAANDMLVYVVLKNREHAGVPFFGERKRWSDLRHHLRTISFTGSPVDFLKEGDMVERQLIEGINYVMLNRQPSIWRYSLGAFRARFWDNATIGVPDVALKAFNGDFDGDEFNVWTIRDRKTEAEVIRIYSPSRNVLGNARNSTAYGLHFDPVTGVFIITRVVERRFPVPAIAGDTEAIGKFLDSIENRYFEEQDEQLSSRRYFRVRRAREGDRDVVVFSSEVVVPRDYFIEEVRDHIREMKGRSLERFHERLTSKGAFFIPDEERGLGQLARSYSGRAAFSLLLPDDFYFDNGKIKIEGGVLVRGTVTKSEIGAFSHSTIFHELTRIYGYDVCSRVIDSLVWFTKTYLTRGNTISFGLEDYGFVGREAERETDRVAWVRRLVREYEGVYSTIRSLALDLVPVDETTVNRVLREIRGMRVTEEVKGFLAKYCATKDEKEARDLLIAATTLEEKNEAMYAEVKLKVEELERLKREAALRREYKRVDDLEDNIVDLLNGLRAQEAKNIEAVVDPENAFIKCEGKRGNIFEVMGSIGLQTVSGRRIHTGSNSNRALASLFPGDTTPEALGMVMGNFTRGLEPSEAAFLAWAARIGPVVTKTQTSVIGDIANRMTNAFQGIVMVGGAPVETVRETANVVQMAYGFDNLDPKFMLVRKGDQQFDPLLPPGAREDYQRDKAGQTTIDVASLQLLLDDMSGPGTSASMLGTAEEVELVNAFLRRHVVNRLAYRGPPPGETDEAEVYAVGGVTFITAQRAVQNVRTLLFNSICALRFPDGANRPIVIRAVLKEVIARMTGNRGTVDSVHIKNGDKVGRFISGAIQQPIMQAALNTFHASGQTSSASTVKDRFIRLVTASSSGKRSSTVFLTKTPATFHEAYARRNQLRDITLDKILETSQPTIHRAVEPGTIPERVRRVAGILHPSLRDRLRGELVTYIVYGYDPVMVHLSGLTSYDLTRVLEQNRAVLPVVVETGETPSIYFFTERDVSAESAIGVFQNNIISKISSIKITANVSSGVGADELYPTEFDILEGVKNVYRTDSGYVVRMTPRHMERYAYSIKDVMGALEAAGYHPEKTSPSELFIATTSEKSPVADLRDRRSREEADVEARWKESVERGERREPRNPGLITEATKRFYLKGIGGSLTMLMRHPLVDYRSSFTDGITDIQATLGLRAARNFMVHEIEQIFSLSGSNEIDYRHVVLMIDSMVSQGSISRLTFQGVDKIAGPNPLNQAGVGYAPAATFAIAALKKKDYRADVGYAVNFLATGSRFGTETIPEDKAIARSQEEKIMEYMQNISTKRSARTSGIYDVVRTKRIRERELMGVFQREHAVPVSRDQVPPPAPVCGMPTAATSHAFRHDIGEYYGGGRLGLDVFGRIV